MRDRHDRKSKMLEGREYVRKLELYKARKKSLAQLRILCMRERREREREVYVLVRRKV